MSALTTIGLPVALGIIMFGLGLSLTLADFARVLKQPKAVIIALVCQLILLPAICFGLVLAFQLPPVLAVGMMMLAASPGGTTANLYSHLFRGDIALNISLTAVNSVIAVVTLPLITNFAIWYFNPFDDQLGMQWAKVIEVFAIVLLPVAAGMIVRRLWPAFAKGMDKPVRIASIIILVVVIAGAVASELGAPRRELRAPVAHHDRVLPDQPHDRLLRAAPVQGRQAPGDRVVVRDRHPQRDARDRDRPDRARLGRAEPAGGRLRRADVLHRVRLRVPHPRAQGRGCRADAEDDAAESAEPAAAS